MKKEWLILGIILVAAIYLRGVGLDSTPPGLYPDEAMNGNNAIETLRTGDYKVYYEDNNGREGLYIWLQAAALQWLPQTASTLRLPSVWFGIITVLGLYLLLRETYRGEFNSQHKKYDQKVAGLTATFFLATSFWHINFSRIAFRAIMAPAFMVLALWLFLKSLNKETGGWGFWYAAGAGIFFGLGFYSYIAYRIMPLLFLGFIPFYYKDKRFWQMMGCLVVATFIVAAPLGFYYLQNPTDFFGRTTQIAVTEASNPLYAIGFNTLKTIGMFNIVGDFNWRHNYAGAPLLVWPVGLLFLLGLVYSVRQIFRTGFRKNDSLPAWLWLIWLVLALVPVITSNEGLPHALRAILAVPPVFILAGIGGGLTYEWLRHKTERIKWLAPGTAVLLALVLAGQSYQMYFYSWGENEKVAEAFKAKDQEIAQEINATLKQTPKYILVESGPGVKGIPISAQSVAFLTNSFLPEDRKENNIIYVTKEDLSNLSSTAKLFKI